MLYDPADGAFENPAAAEAKLREKVESLVAKGVLNPWCALCNSRVFRYEDRPTAFPSLAAAVAAAKQQEAAQLYAGSILRTARN
jgi:hypothetical protein